MSRALHSSALPLKADDRLIELSGLLRAITGSHTVCAGPAPVTARGTSSSKSTMRSRAQRAHSGPSLRFLKLGAARTLCFVSVKVNSALVTMPFQPLRLAAV